MASQGVKELILVAQETTVYGTDLYGKKTLHLLLKKLCGIKGIRWIRILYCYPEEIYDELIQVMKEEKKSATIWIFHPARQRPHSEKNGKAHQ